MVDAFSQAEVEAQAIIGICTLRADASKSILSFFHPLLQRSRMSL